MESQYASVFITLMGCGSSYILYNESLDLSIDIVDHLSVLMLLLISFLYFVSDFYLMIKNYKPAYTVYFIHHFIGITSILIVYFKYYFLVKYLLSYLTYEISTIFLNISKYLHHNKINNIISKTCNILFLISYTVVRILFGSYVSILSIQRILDLSGYYIKIIILLPILLQVLNFIWYYKLIKFLQRNSNDGI